MSLRLILGRLLAATRPPPPPPLPNAGRLALLGAVSDPRARTITTTTTTT